VQSHSILLPLLLIVNSSSYFTIPTGPDYTRLLNIISVISGIYGALVILVLQQHNSTMSHNLTGARLVILLLVFKD